MSLQQEQEPTLQEPEVPVTHEGALSFSVSSEVALLRAVRSCLLWEDSFYEDGESIAARIASLVPQVAPEKVAELAVHARTQMNLRHVPLLLATEMTRYATHRPFVADTVARIIQRPDELTEILAVYARDREGTKKLNRLSKGLQRGIASAFTKFNEYQLAKYNRKSEIKLRDALFLSHAKPIDEKQGELWKRLIDGTLETPDTWEVAISAATDKTAEWTRLLSEGRLGALALLRNLRNMVDAGVPIPLIEAAIIDLDSSRVLPFRFIAAARHAPRLEASLEVAMLDAMGELPRLPGKTAIVVDHSGSMHSKLSQKSDMTCFDAACGLAILAREICEEAAVFAFSDHTVRVPSRRGFALRDALDHALDWGLTNTQNAMDIAAQEGYDRLLLITDEQSQTSAHPRLDKPIHYGMNIGTQRNGITYGSRWIHVDGFSSNVLSFIGTYENIL